MDFKHILTRIVSVILILSGFYHLFLSINAIFFIYPDLHPDNYRASLILQKGLIEKALLIYAVMIVNSTYGLALLLKPSQEVKIIHAIIGVFIAIASVFFITKTPFTTDPIFNFIKEIFLLYTSEV